MLGPGLTAPDSFKRFRDLALQEAFAPIRRRGRSRSARQMASAYPDNEARNDAGAFGLVLAGPRSG